MSAISLILASSSKQSAAYRHSGPRPGIQYIQPRYIINGCFMDSGSRPGMTVCCLEEDASIRLIADIHKKLPSQCHMPSFLFGNQCFMM